MSGMPSRSQPPTFKSIAQTRPDLSGRPEIRRTPTDERPTYGGFRGTTPGAASVEAGDYFAPANESSDVSGSSSALVGGGEVPGVEETLEYFQWTGKGSSKALEQEIINELALVDTANVHSMIEGDERTSALERLLDSAIKECDDLSLKLTLYKTQLFTLEDSLKYMDEQRRERR
ncbi:uncharacterized protein V1510DRAFT_420724 [Dipodascopsis tothii]|uniref:uncharacterized protein n=1 Tax=Dipodascopsis tothii TaxID=44089 RepID=UPI0034CD0B38